MADMFAVAAQVAKKLVSRDRDEEVLTPRRALV
jgi:hypothetical protein